MISKEQKALLSMCEITHWRSIVALTLNLKQVVRTLDNGFIGVDEFVCRKAFSHYMRQLNELVYKAAYRRHGKRLRVIPVLEKSADGRWHYHVAIEPPAHVDAYDFGKLAMSIWLAQELGYGFGDVSFDADRGWISYQLKRRSKDGLECFLDCLDIDAFNNPIADA